MNLPINIHQQLLAPTESQKKLGEKAKALRLFHGLKRTSLSEKSGVSAETIRNFEQTGKITLENFLRIVFALHEEHKLADLFALPEVSSLKDIQKLKQPLPKRGRK
ncbi:MAG: helix-turn-helix transcriptional regulator [Ghiorsea sp.]|nr:helix-turn-helix transcriptional regulator [Ghiorsea sp.]